MRKKQIHVKSYMRSRHGRAKFGGEVSSHNKSGRASVHEMNAVRAKNALSKFTRYDGKVMSWKELVDNYGIRASEAEVPSVRFNRIKFNRMDNNKQAEFEAKRAITKPDYRIFTSDDLFISVPKFVYGYAKEIGL